MSRWSIGNLVMPMSHDQFIDLSAQFKAAAERSFGAACRLEVRAMNAVKITSHFMHDDGTERWMAEQNRARTFFQTDDPAKLGRDVWDKAVYVEVSVTPVEGAKAPVAAWGHAEFKGNIPQQATFYLQPDSDDAAKEMIGKNRTKLIGDGYTSNTDANAGPIRRFAF